jgi:hypothetical protein
MTALLSPGLIILTYQFYQQIPSEFWLMRHKDATFAYVFTATRDSHGSTGGYRSGASAERLS